MVEFKLNFKKKKKRSQFFKEGIFIVLYWNNCLIGVSRGLPRLSLCLDICMYNNNIVIMMKDKGIVVVV